MIASHAAAGSAGNVNDTAYAHYVRSLSGRIATLTSDGRFPVFTTDTSKLWDLYLSSFPESDRQYHNCHACRRFIETYGGLVTIDHVGMLTAVCWDPLVAPPDCVKSVKALERAVMGAAVTGVFVTTQATWGTPVTGQWSHFAIAAPERLLWKSKTDTASQRAAEFAANRQNVLRALAEFKPKVINDAFTLLEADALYRSEKIIGQVRWLVDLLKAQADAKGKRQREHVVWKAIALAPDGFCHPRSGVVGSLLEDLAGGVSVDAAAAAFARKMKPESYQRPKAAPSDGAIAAAEKIAEALGIGPSLMRRYMRVEEVPSIWEPKPATPTEPGGGVFAHLRSDAKDDAQDVRSAAKAITWAKFERDVLPKAIKIEAFAPSRGNYSALVTAANPDAPPIFQWDREDNRNPASSYVWVNGATALSFGLLDRSWVNVLKIARLPHKWNDPEAFDQHGKGALFILEGARETRHGGSALFPEWMRSELHGVRSVIEAHSNKTQIEGRDKPHAAGLSFSGANPVTVRVSTGGSIVLTYLIDRVE